MIKLRCTTYLLDSIVKHVTKAQVNVFYTWWLAVFNSYCIAGRLGEVVVNGKKIRQCKGCKEKTCNLQDGETFMLKFILPPLTSTPVNLIFPLMRKSTGGKVELGNLQFQYSFIRNWW